LEVDENDERKQIEEIFTDLLPAALSESPSEEVGMVLAPVLSNKRKTSAADCIPKNSDSERAEPIESSKNKITKKSGWIKRKTNHNSRFL
jgi:hypothetical protein